MAPNLLNLGKKKKAVKVISTNHHWRTAGSTSENIASTSRSSEPEGHNNHHHQDLISFTFRELATATNNFRRGNNLGTGGFGSVFWGFINSTGLIIAAKRYRQGSLQGQVEFLMEILMHSILHHPNIIKLIGYCSEGDERLIVYEYMVLGSLERHLFDAGKEPLDWNTRVKIAAGVAKALQFLHTEAKPKVIFRDVKSTNILLDEGFHPKLSDFGLSKFVVDERKPEVVSRPPLGTRGCCAPEYLTNSMLTTMVDVYGFGVLMLELVTGTRPVEDISGQEVYLADWAKDVLKDRGYIYLADGRLNYKYSEEQFKEFVDLALLCVEEEAGNRPTMSEVVECLDRFVSSPYMEGQSPSGEVDSVTNPVIPQDFTYKYTETEHTSGDTGNDDDDQTGNNDRRIRQDEFHGQKLGHFSSGDLERMFASLARWTWIVKRRKNLDGPHSI